MTLELDRPTRTLAFARFALSKIEQLRLPADPYSFELWYIYATGHNQALNKAIDAILTQSGGITEVELARLANAHLASMRSASRLNAIATDLSDEITQVMGMIEAASTSADTYGQHIDEGLHKIGRTDNPTLKPIVEALVVATREMETKTKALESRLEESRIKTLDLQQDVEALRLESQTDSLTLVGNRQYFDEALVNMAAVAKNTGERLSLLFADIDHFKKFNDTFGHQIGDQVLRLVAATMKESLRDGDVIARYGGEEFGMLLPGALLPTAKMVAERMRIAVMARDLKKRATQESLGRITLSIGVAQLHEAEHPIDLVGRADACLYAAKRAGRNRVIAERDAEYIAGESQTAPPYRLDARSV